MNLDYLKNLPTPRYKTEGDKAYRLDVTTGEWVEVQRIEVDNDR